MYHSDITMEYYDVTMEHEHCDITMENYDEIWRLALYTMEHCGITMEYCNITLDHYDVTFEHCDVTVALVL